SADRVARDARAVDAATQHEHVERATLERIEVAGDEHSSPVAAPQHRDVPRHELRLRLARLALKKDEGRLALGRLARVPHGDIEPAARGVPAHDGLKT